MHFLSSVYLDQIIDDFLLLPHIFYTTSGKHGYNSVISALHLMRFCDNY